MKNLSEISPFFSVVIPSYNRNHLIQKAIKSVLNQTFKDYEIIVADDCSTDSTEESIIKMSIPNLKFVKNKVNKGNAGARNLGAKNSSGKYICYLDSDDQYHCDFLEKMYALIHKYNNPGFLWCNVNRINIQDENLGPAASSSWKPMDAEDHYLFFLRGLHFGTDFGFTIRRDCFEKTGYFDESLRAAVDTDFMLRIVQDFDFAYTLEVLLDTYDHVGVRVRKDSTQKLKSYLIIYEKHKGIIEKHRDLHKRWSYKIMWLSYHNGHKKEGRKFFNKAGGLVNKKALVTAALFELFPIDLAIELHKKISSL